MKKTIMNFEIENVLNILNDKNSFRNDLSVKLPNLFDRLFVSI